MRRFTCPNCNNEVHFRNTVCNACTTELVYLATSDRMLSLSAQRKKTYVGLDGYRSCTNRKLIECNWLSVPSSQSDLCQSCSHTTKIPDISDLKIRSQWSRLELAKRRLFYALIKSGLHLETEGVNAPGALRFELLSDGVARDGRKKRVITGHDNGLITINISEADDVIREKNRTAMGEPYRTLIGHFRHEIGHYYWDKLIASTGVIDRFRQVFGDERADYANALKTYYTSGPMVNWQDGYVSTYASAHPWEDFAETWSHYFHMISGLETAYAYGISPQPLLIGTPPMGLIVDPYRLDDFGQLLSNWIPITIAMNAMNRSIGHNDYYPFVLSPHVQTKLEFIHDLIKGR